MANMRKIKAKLTPLVPLGGNRFSEKICAAAGIRHTQKVRGRPAGKPDQAGDAEAQNEFGF